MNYNDDRDWEIEEAMYRAEKEREEEERWYWESIEMEEDAIAEANRESEDV